MENKKKILPFFGLVKLWPYIKGYTRTIIVMLIMAIVSSSIDALYPLLTRYALNHYVLTGSLKGIEIFGIAGISILLFQVLDNYISVYMCGKVEMSVDRDLRNAAFSHLQELSFSYYNQNTVGYIHSRVMSDTGKIGEVVSWRIMDIMWQGGYVIGAVVIMLVVNLRLALLVLLVFSVAILLILYFQKKLMELNRQVREMNATISGDFNEGITGARTIKTLVVEKKLNREFQEDTGKMRTVSVRTAHVSALFQSSIALLSALALAVVLWRGGTLSSQGLLEVATLSVFMTYAMNMIDPIEQLVSIFAALIAITANIERFTGLMETEADVADTPEVIRKYGDSFEPKRENWEDMQGDVEFEHVSFHYPDGEEMVLSDFCLKVPEGTSVAIVGETGAGKTTLVNLVCRFFEPTQGRILIDSRDARERSLLWLHNHIGYVLQTPHLFSGTVRENLTYGNPDASDEQIYEALRMVSAEDILKKMEHGLDSEVGEGGSLLSTGEKQLLSFARALLADPRILILDEATSSVDTMTERKIQEGISALTRGRTSFVIAHRLSTIVSSDLILLVSDGKILERGTHEELMRMHGEYYSLYSKQYEDLVPDIV